jgi:hypothetical protein
MNATRASALRLTWASALSGGGAAAFTVRLEQVGALP